MRLKLKSYHKPSLLLLLVLSTLMPACTTHPAKANSKPVAPAENEFALKKLKTKTLGNGKGEYREISLATNEPLATSYELIAVKVDDYQAGFYRQSNQQVAANVSTIGYEEKAFMAINGGFFTPSFTPDGLFAQNGKVLSPESQQPIFTAMVVINQQGQLEIGPGDMSYQNAKYAIQAGPLLINQGRMLVSKVNQFDQSAARTVLAESSDGQLIVVSTSDMSLYTLENILYEHPEWFGVQKIITAVNLDGGKSSALYINNSQAHRIINGKNKVENILYFI
jgi:exopolysaccharide biosynthesis protein